MSSKLPLVAPLAGSVDRNQAKVADEVIPSVAPLAGSVDRNWLKRQIFGVGRSRSPRGERG